MGKVGLGAEKEGRHMLWGVVYQKFEGEYLFATRTIARVESEDVGNTAWVEEG